MFDRDRHHYNSIHDIGDVFVTVADGGAVVVAVGTQDGTVGGHKMLDWLIGLSGLGLMVPKHHRYRPDWGVQLDGYVGSVAGW